jgi:hypothetical protein
MKIDWIPAPALVFACPVCLSDGAKPSVVAVESPFNSQDLFTTARLRGMGNLELSGADAAGL